MIKMILNYSSAERPGLLGSGPYAYAFDYKALKRKAQDAKALVNTKPAPLLRFYPMQFIIKKT